MSFRYLKTAIATLLTLFVAGFFIFGHELGSYVNSSVGSVRSTVKQAVPLEFQLKRARDMIDEIVPELKANIQVIAEEKVEVARLDSDIFAAEEQLASKEASVRQLRHVMNGDEMTYLVSGRELTRKQLTQRLSHRFNQVKQGQTILESKRRLLETRKHSLAAAEEMLERTRARKAEMEQQIEALVAQHRLLKAQSVDSKYNLDESQLARTDKLLDQIKKRLDTEQGVLNLESEWNDGPIVDMVQEDELLAEIDTHFQGSFSEIAALDQD